MAIPKIKSISTYKSKAITLTAKEFIKNLTALRPKVPLDHSKFFQGDDPANTFLGVRHADIFALAKKYMQMPLSEMEQLLKSNFYEVRMGAVSIMDFQARDKKVTEDQKKKLYQLYLRLHDRINNWDLVDRSAPFVVGGYLFDKPRTPLYKLSKSRDPWERRTAIVSTYYFIRQNDLDDTFTIASLLVNDKHELVQKAVGSWVREAGKRDKKKLLSFLDTYAAGMPRVTLRYAVEKLEPRLKQHYMKVID